jgi:hypothetical protein
MSRPLPDDSRAELAALQSNEWVIEYRRSLPKAIWEAARAEAAIDARADGAADSFPLDEEATKRRLEGNLLRFTSVPGRPREVPIDVLRSIRVKVDHGRGALEGAGLGLLAGAGLGSLAGFARGSDPPPPTSDCGLCSFTASQKAVFGAIAGGVVGLGVGLLVGAIVGHGEFIEF